MTQIIIAAIKWLLLRISNSTNQNMKTKFTFARSIYPVIIFTLFSVSCQKNSENAASGNNTATAETGGGQSAVLDDESQKNIVQIAVSSKDHSTLVAAVQAVHYEDVLVNAGPFTVFAPTNAAFDKLPAGTVDNLLKPENKAALENILEYHVSIGGYKQENFQNNQVIGQANGNNITLTEKDGKWFVNNAQILGAANASNGIVYIIDAVLLPPDKK